MCGLSGFIAKSSVNIAEDVLRSMLKKLSHRGPDHGAFKLLSLNNDIKVGLAHTLLHIIGKPDEGKQPFKVGSDYLLFNGAIYNFSELGNELKKNYGVNLKTTTDTEVLAWGFHHEGVDFLKKTRGMFAIAYWRDSAEKLYLARDPFGVKPLYYHYSDNLFCFASEYKAILPHLKQSCINPLAVNDYLRLRYVPGNRTLIETIQKVPPGTLVEFSLREKYFQIHQYFHLNSNPNEPSSREVYDHLVSAIQRRSIADVEIAALLSGGIDSSFACDILQKNLKSLKTYTLGFSGNSIDETDKVKKICSRIGVENSVIESLEPSLERLKKLIYHLDDPYGDPIIFALDRIFSGISGKQKVVVTGEGADEIFSGYVHHRALGILTKLSPVTRKILATGSKFFPKKLLGKILPYSGKMTPQDFVSAIKRAEVFLANNTLKNFQAIFHLFEENDLAQHIDDLSTMASPVPADLVSLRHWDYRYWMSDSQLFKLDKISMASSIEAREPYVDVDLINAVEGIPSHKHISARQDKLILRQAIAPYTRIGQEIIFSRKSSFFQPFDVQSGIGLARDLRHCIIDNKSFLAGYVKPDKIEFALSDKNEGVLAQKRLFALGALSIWKHEIHQTTATGELLG